MIVCCGEALIDMLPRESKAGEPAFAPYAGGAVFNSAIALGWLGAPVEFFCGLSSDLFGQQIRDVLASSNAGSRYAPISARPTTLAFVRLTDGQATYTFYGEHRRPHAGRGRPASLRHGHRRHAVRRHQPDSRTQRFGLRGADETRARRPRHDARPEHRPGFIPDKAGHRAHRSA